MVQFGTGYYMPMDRDYEMADTGTHPTPGSSSGQSTGDVGVSIGGVGMSLGLGPVPNVQAVAAKLRPGSKTVELNFMGMGKGSGQGHTPGMYGKKQRQALSEVAKANEVNFTTHSTVGVYGLAGMDQQGNFSKAQKHNGLNEIKRAVEFAADVSGGGPVVVHTGEFQRPIVDAAWNKRKGDPYKGKFQMFEDEDERTSFRVIDKRTGGLIAEARKNKSVSRPLWLTAKKGHEYVDYDGRAKTATGKEKETIYLGYLDNKRIEPGERLPEFDKKTGYFKTKQYGWGDLIDEAEEMTLRTQRTFEKWDEMSKKDQDKSIWRERIEQARDLKKAGFKEAAKNKLEIKPEEAYIIATLETNAGHSRGWALQYGGDFDEDVKAMKKLLEAKKFYQKIEDEVDKKEKWRLMRAAGDKYGLGDLVPSETQLPTAVIESRMKMLRQRMEQSREAASSQMSQAEEAMETIRNVQSAETYALEESFDSYARAGITAMRQTADLKKKGKLTKPIAMAMENLFPESYGSHPDEIIHLVKGSREKMTHMLQKEYGFSKKEAEDKAETHLTMTFDTGHMNMWRKYWKGDPDKTIEQNDNDFDNWMLKKVEEMAPYIGHLHIVDNYGYQDDHLAPGEGNTPVRKIVKMLKDKGYKGEMIVEPGADYTTDASGFHSVMKTWRHFDIPFTSLPGVSGASTGGGAKTWENVGYGFFGQNQPAYFTFGAYRPSEEWAPWSGTPLD